MQNILGIFFLIPHKECIGCLIFKFGMSQYSLRHEIEIQIIECKLVTADFVQYQSATGKTIWVVSERKAA